MELKSVNRRRVQIHNLKDLLSSAKDKNEHDRLAFENTFEVNKEAS